MPSHHRLHRQSSRHEVQLQQQKQYQETPPTLYLNNIDSKEFRKAMTQESGFVWDDDVLTPPNSYRGGGGYSSSSSNANDMEALAKEYEVQVFEIKLDE